MMITFITNYLDDFLFMYITQEGCNHIVVIFLKVCKEINFLVAEDKTEWASPFMTFLGMLLNGRSLTLSIPEDKRKDALGLVQMFRDRKKATIKELQRLAGHLNFINRTIVPGRVFTTRMHAKFTGSTFKKLKPHHHVRLDKEFKQDCSMWVSFLTDLSSVVRPCIDMEASITAKELNFYSDTSAAEQLGFGIIFRNSWAFRKWPEGFVKNCKPNIEFLELYAMCIGIFI